MELRGRLEAVEFIQIFLHDKRLDEMTALGGERELVFRLQLFDDETEHFPFGEGGIREQLPVPGETEVGLRLQCGKGFEELSLIRGRVGLFHEPLVESGELGAQQLIFGCAIFIL